MVRLVATKSEIQQLAKKYNTSQALIKKALTSLSYSFAWHERWEEKIEEEMYFQKDRRENLARWNVRFER